ncbi:MAG: FeoB-associated Cys-rich membrane protein [Chthoniobacteraceae bacterium]
MNPNLDHLLVSALIIGAAFFLFRRFFPGKKAAKKGCGSGCGCGSVQKK